MVRTIYVVFVEDKVSNTSHLKEYMFLCPFDYIRVGDIIKDPRYVPYMQVTRITPCSARVQEGFTLLRTLALNAYTKDELELNYGLIESKVDQACGCFNTPMCEQKKFQVLAKLAIIAKHYNKNWKKTTCNTGYFLGNYNNGNGPVVECCKGVGVYQHNTVQYAGVVYFKNQEDAIKAVKILGDEVKELFK